MTSIIKKVRDRRIGQWALAYLAAGWLAVQVVGELGPRWGLSEAAGRAFDVTVFVGFFLTLVLAWFHGAEGRQAIAATEVVAVCILVALGGLGVARELGQSEPSAVTSEQDATGQPVLAVLPFESQSPDAGDGYFADAVHADVLTALASSLSGVTVLGRPAVMQYKDSELSAGEIGEELGATTLLTATVWSAGDLVRLNFELIDPATVATVRGMPFTVNRSVEELFEAQARVASGVAAELGVVMSDEQEARISSPPTASTAAYDLYIRGREQYLLLEDSTNNSAITLFRSALAEDSSYAQAWAGLADAFARRVCCYQYPPEWGDSAVAYARKAIDLDPRLAAAYKALGQGLSVGERIGEAIEAYEAALTFDPSHAESANNLSLEMRNAGRLSEALVWAERAVRLMPNIAPPAQNLVASYQALGMELEARVALEELQARFRDHGWRLREALLWDDPDVALDLAHAHRAGGNEAGTVDVVSAYLASDYSLAIEWSEEVIGRAPDAEYRNEWYPPKIVRGISLAALGRMDEAREVLEPVTSEYESRVTAGATTWRFPWAIAVSAAALGDLEGALARLQEAYALGFRNARLMQLDPALAPLRGMAQFEALSARIAADLAEARASVVSTTG